MDGGSIPPISTLCSFGKFRLGFNRYFVGIDKKESLKNGVDGKAYIFDNFVVLSTSRIKLRNITTLDHDLKYFDELIVEIKNLYDQGVSVVPILGYVYDENDKYNEEEAEYGKGYIIMSKAKGEEVWDDAVVNPQPYLEYNKMTLDEKVNYILDRTSFLASVPQTQYDKFIDDVFVINDKDILIDFRGKSNFFYDEMDGFQFIDLDSHTDFKYGINDQNTIGGDWRVLFTGFVPCHQSISAEILSKLSGEESKQLEENNVRIFEKCRTALVKRGIEEEKINQALVEKKIEIWGKNV